MTDVHIVRRTDGHIIERMSAWLAERNKWTISEQPREDATVNLYMPYYLAVMQEIPETLSAAWFTHYEVGTKWKVNAWRDAIDFVEMQLITAPVYETFLPKAMLVRPGVDRERFRPMKVERTSSNRIVGTAGVGQPRKGPRLLVDLYYSGLPNLEMRIIGANWPFPHQYLKDGQLPEFFNSIDIYLCTSTQEGIPAPVLEALACDCKVVIPSGVGICDLLPEMPGVRHYEAGDSVSMIAAIERCLEDVPSAHSLRILTERFSIDEWCTSVKSALVEEPAYA